MPYILPVPYILVDVLVISVAMQRQPHRARERVGTPASLVAAIAAAGLWLLFVGSITTDELLIGVPAVGLSLWFLLLLGGCQPNEIRLRFTDLLEGWRIAGYIFADSFTVTTALLRDLAGGPPVGSFYRAVRFESRDHSPDRIGRGVLATAFSTAAPNTIVLGIDPESSLMVYHELKRSPVAAMTKRLGARP